MVVRKKKGSRHKGVVLLKPEPARRTGWRIRYRDPDSGKVTKPAVPASLTTAEQRTAFAVAKSRELARRKMELEAGAVRATRTSLAEAIELYYKAHPKLRDRTLVAYRGSTDKLLGWAAANKVKLADELTRSKLLTFKEQLVSEPRHVRAIGGRRGEVRPSSEPRSPYSVNRELRGLRTVLGYLRDRDQLAKLSHDDLRIALKRLRVDIEKIDYLKPHECRQLLEAALFHDEERFVETRAEHAGEGRTQLGTTPRYEPIAPFLAFVLLTGVRLGEAIALKWPSVELDSLDHDGHKVGEIELSASATKTHKARTIGLDVSPALHAMLSAMRPKTRKGSVFGISRGVAEAAGKRLRMEYGAPASFTWQALRRTCGTYLTNAPGIFGSTSAYRSAAQLGHSVQVATKHYLSVARGIPRDARTLEAAMQIEDVMARIVERAAEPNREGAERHAAP